MSETMGRFAGAAVLVSLVAACGGDKNADPPSTALTTVKTSIGPIATNPGTEKTNCIERRLDNAAPGWVRRVRGSLMPGSHHMIAYLSDATEEQLEPQPCSGFDGLLVTDGSGIPGLDSKNVPIFIVQQAQAELSLPDDGGLPVAFHVDAHQMLRIELHWFNTTGAARDVTGNLELDLLREDHPVIESSFSFWGTTVIDIPPHSDAETPVLFQRALAETKAFAVTTHEHQRGTRMRVWNGTGPDAANGTPTADNALWSEPPLDLLKPPLFFDVGDGLAYQCNWTNPTDKAISFGESVDDEMCFLWLYYYPSRGFDICVNFTAGSASSVCNHLVR